MYLYLYSYRRETARQLRMYAQLTCCFSAVAELLVEINYLKKINTKCNSVLYCSGRSNMKVSRVKLSKRGKRPMILKLRQWDLPDIWKKTELVTSAADHLLKKKSNIEAFNINILSYYFFTINGRFVLRVMFVQM